MIWVYGAAGLVVIVIVASLVGAVISSAKAKGSITVELDVPEYYGYAGKITAHVDTVSQSFALVGRWKTMIDRIEKGEEPEPYDAAKHAGRLP